MPPALPAPCPSPTQASSQASALAREIWGSQAVPVHCFTALWLYPRLAELKYPGSSLAHILGHLHTAKPFWAEGCPAGCTLQARQAGQMVRNAWRDLCRHCLSQFVPLPVSRATVPCKYSPGVLMCKHYLMSSCCKSHGKAADFPPCWSPQQHQGGHESPAPEYAFSELKLVL